MGNSRRGTIQTDGRGRITLPPELRRHLGVEPRGLVSVEPRDDGSLVLRDPHGERRHRLRTARGAFRNQGQSVSDLLAERRTEAAGENAR